MRKKWLAIGILGCAGGALAQSSVTMYGVADVSVGQSRSPAINGTAFASDPLAVAHHNRQFQMNSSSSMNNGISIFGLRGVEDVGGGMHVGFNFEAALSLKDGSTGQDNGTFWGRQAKVTLSGPWGGIQLGRQFTPSFYAMYAYDLTGQAVYSLIDQTYGFGVGQATNQLSPRTNSAFMYTTPTVAGITGRVAYVTKADNQLFARERSKWDASLVYAHGPVVLTGAANQVKGNHTNWELGGKYDFGQVGNLGQFSIAGGYLSTALQTPQNGGDTALNLARRGVSLAGQYRTGPYTLTLNVTRDTKNEIPVAFKSRATKHTNEMLEGRYALSKRTFLYAVYLHFDGDNNYALGLRHNF